MELTLTSSALAILVSVVTSSIVTVIINKRNNRANERKNLDRQLDDLLKIALNYPYLESSKFVSCWNDQKDQEDEKFIRYDLYCNLLFNYLARLAEYHKFDKEKIDKHISAKDWVRFHKDNWLNPYDSYENIDSYDKKFRDIINEYING